MTQKVLDIKDRCYDILDTYENQDTLISNEDKTVITLLRDILDREVLLDINLFFNEDGSHITKRDYGAILVSRLVEDLARDYL